MQPKDRICAFPSVLRRQGRVDICDYCSSQCSRLSFGQVLLVLQIVCRSSVLVWECPKSLPSGRYRCIRRFLTYFVSFRLSQSFYEMFDWCIDSLCRNEEADALPDGQCMLDWVFQRLTNYHFDHGWHRPQCVCHRDQGLRLDTVYGLWRRHTIWIPSRRSAIFHSVCQRKILFRECSRQCIGGNRPALCIRCCCI